MKLNYKRTVMVGFAFFLICSFWQAYDNTVPLILTNKFGMSQTWSGVIMALDNVLALFLLPLFGHISDKCTSRHGRRTPFIVIGTLIAAVALVCLSFVDNAQLKNLQDVSAIDDPAALSVIYEEEKAATLLTPSGEKFILGQKFTEEEFTAIRSQITDGDSAVTNPDYTNYVVPARQACAWQMTAEHPATLIFFVVLLLIILVAMATFRSPAVALMPDVTLKPLRSKANAVINLMGSAGGILVLALGMVFATSAVRNSLMSYIGYFGVIAALMLAALVIFLLTVREQEWSAEMQQQAVAAGLEEQSEADDPTASRKLSADEVKSLIFILLMNAGSFMNSFFNLMSFGCACAYAITMISAVLIHKKHPEWYVGNKNLVKGGNFTRFLAMIIMIAIAYFCTLGQGKDSWICFGIYLGIGACIWLWMVLVRWKKSKVVIDTPDGSKEF